MGDLLFFAPNVQHPELPVPIMSAEQIRAQAVELWKLNDRSWYGYSLNNAAYGAWFSLGLVEELDEDLRDKLASAQIRLKVPTLIRQDLISKSLRRKLPRFSRHVWLTAATLRSLSRTEKIECLKSWFRQNKVITYGTVKVEHLSPIAQHELQRLRLTKIVNRYPKTSGANCFGAVIGMISPNWQNRIVNQWAHWALLEESLARRGFTKEKSDSPRRGDVLVFLRKNTPVHAAYVLDDETYFEKPGQDFYEPYRLVRLKKWKQEWPKSKIEIYRRIGAI
ncbi:MAG: hypothetical protein JNJ49_03895 [Bdellovibrionaceae bacterium]|nr:hypothetical protein [Pseudobdellovibrionaceae bacterium]